MVFVREGLPISPPAPTKDPTRTILIIIVIVAVLAIIAVIIITLLRKRAASKTGSTPTSSTSALGSTTAPSTPGVKCENDNDCPSRCNPSTKLCVECLDDSTCENPSLPLCLTSSNRCVACFDDTNCDSNSTCSGNQCCDPRRPIINNVVLNLYASNGTKLSQASVTINYTYFQIAKQSRLFILIEDPATGKTVGPAGRICDTKVKCAFSSNCPEGQRCIEGKCSWPSCIESTVTGQVIIYESATGMNFFLNSDYRIRLQILYTCGKIENALTDPSLPFNFSTPVVCSQNLTRITIVSIVNGATDTTGIINNGLNIRIQMVAAENPGRLRLLFSTVPNAHPSLCQVLGPFQWVYGTQLTPPITTPLFFMLLTRQYPPAAGTYYFRLYDIGVNGNCYSQLSNQVVYTYVL